MEAETRVGLSRNSPRGFGCAARNRSVVCSARTAAEQDLQGPGAQHWLAPWGPRDDSPWVEIIGWQRGWYLREHAHAHTRIHTGSWREVRWISKVARGCSLTHNNNKWKKEKKKPWLEPHKAITLQAEHTLSQPVWWADTSQLCSDDKEAIVKLKRSLARGHRTNVQLEDKKKQKKQQNRGLL